MTRRRMMTKNHVHQSNPDRARVSRTLEIDHCLTHEQRMTRYLLSDMEIGGNKLDDIAIMDASVQRTDAIEG